jgi:hypothetical protein
MLPNRTRFDLKSSLVLFERDFVVIQESDTSQKTSNSIRIRKARFDLNPFGKALNFDPYRVHVGLNRLARSNPSKILEPATFQIDPEFGGDCR